MLFRIIFALASLDSNLVTARKQALSMCTSVENVGSAMASMPYYMSTGVNQLTADGIEKAIHGLMQMLILSITGVEEIVVFIINLLTSTYVCLITFAVGGSLEAAIAVAEDVGSFLNSTVKDVGSELGKAESGFQTAMNSFLADLSKLESVFTGKKPTAPTIDLTSEISTLNGLRLPANYDADLQKLNASIPTFAQVHNFTNNAIKWPFEEVKTLLNESLPKYTVNSSLFPVPAKEQLTFCSSNDGINKFFDDLVEIKDLAYKVSLGVLIAAAVLACVPMGWREMRRWKKLKERAQIIQSGDHSPMDSVYIASRPYTSDFGLKLASIFKLQSARRRTLMRWSVAYATSIPALFVLSLAIAGLLACLCQYLLLNAVQKEVPVLENQIIGFADKVINSLNNASEQWAIGTNKMITDVNNNINHDVFGWVNTTTHAVNHTLEVFVDGMVGVLNDTFGGTPLYAPVLDVVNCLILLKITGIEKALTWVSDHAHVDFPLLANDTFSLGTIQKVSGSEADILATGPNGGAANAIADAVYHVTNFLEAAVRQEAILSTCLLLVYVVILLMGAARAVFLMGKGGDDGTYVAPSPTANGLPPSSKESHEMADLSAAPTYEQATGQASGDNNSGNLYRGQPYTLQPQPLPTFQVTTVDSPILQTGFRSPKLGTVSGQNVDAAVRRPIHVRASSHGDYDITSPAYAPITDPFADPSRAAGARTYDEKSTSTNFNPFADPHR